ncbi:MarR family transcriptional regulator [Caulobacter segnis]|uniref:Transcriptional regulator, MarR family n=2 Tax=Caulobacter segnis TaxID=88688 RepID=D5VPT5_CAUST|nr:MarR family transcriptional regulator [Caulobacter segnis]ADG12508.1 transcriptional regulator, MarR family [Caulobacter segnis ATCC 21756]AVQ04086.1 MarR family transcriptional regulator [Caulobacter segnis]
MSDAFASEFEDLFRATYRAAVRRVRDKRERLSPETIALLDHLAAAGPLTAGELARHIDRAPSTLSEMVDHMVDKGLLTRDRDPTDARRSLIWLTNDGQAALLEARTVLDLARLAAAARGLTADQRHALLEALRALVTQLKGEDR